MDTAVGVSTATEPTAQYGRAAWRVMPRSDLPREGSLARDRAALVGQGVLGRHL